MAGKRQIKKIQKKKQRRRSKGAVCAALFVVLLLGGFTAWMWGGAHATHLRYAQLYLQDLPEKFDGVTLLYLSDINIQNARDDAACARLMKKLNALGADILLLGGDYTAQSALNQLGNTQKSENAEINRWLASLATFDAPLGKYAVVGEADDAGELESSFAASGVQLLSDRCATIERNGQELIIAGLSDVSEKKTPYEQIGGYFSGDECVIALAHNPSSYIGIRVAEAKGGGAWADAVLAGHTLGGQIRIGNKTMRTMPDEETRCIAGWYYADDLPMLVSQGLGCKDVKLRLGSNSEIWCITLKKPEVRTLPDF